MRHGRSSGRQVLVGFSGRPPLWWRWRVLRKVVMTWKRRAMQQRARASWEEQQQRLAEEQPPTLLSVLPVNKGGEFDGGRWWVTSVERWSDRTIVQYAIWADDIPEHMMPSLSRSRPQLPRRHVGYMAELSDDCGTTYAAGGGGASSRGHWHNGRSELRTAVPSDATVLKLAIKRQVHVTSQTKPEPPKIETVAELDVQLR